MTADSCFWLNPAKRGTNSLTANSLSALQLNWRIVIKVKIWGSRGSLPASIGHDVIRKKVFKALDAAKGVCLETSEDVDRFIDNHLDFSVRGCYGTNTSCVQIAGCEEQIIFDAGTGLRDFGNHIMGQSAAPGVFHIFISHLHWDHIQGFPFFIPAFLKQNRIHIYGCHPELKEAFVSQQSAPFFPVPFDVMSADIRFSILTPLKKYEIAGLTLSAFEQNHPGGSYAYKAEKNGMSVVYASDAEYKELGSSDNGFIDFIKQADLLIFDAQYSLLDSLHTKENWGHSSNIAAVEVAVQAGVRHVCLFHSEPTCDDKTLDRILEETCKYRQLFNKDAALEVTLAYDGMEIGV